MSHCRFIKLVNGTKVPFPCKSHKHEPTVRLTNCCTNRWLRLGWRGVCRRQRTAPATGRQQFVSPAAASGGKTLAACCHSKTQPSPWVSQQSERASKPPAGRSTAEAHTRVPLSPPFLHPPLFVLMGSREKVVAPSCCQPRVCSSRSAEAQAAPFTHKSMQKRVVSNSIELVDAVLHMKHWQARAGGINVLTDSNMQFFYSGHDSCFCFLFLFFPRRCLNALRLPVFRKMAECKSWEFLTAQRFPSRVHGLSHNQDNCRNEPSPVLRSRPSEMSLQSVPKVSRERNSTI